MTLLTTFYFTYTMEKAEILNGRLAMIGILAALGAYAMTGQVVPGLW